MDRSVLVIGAGVAGLAAGCFAAKSGYETTILEMDNTPGGLCTSWRRGGYLFDANIAALAGSGPDAPLYKFWKDIGVADECELWDPDSFGSVRCSDGRIVTVYTDVDRLHSHLMQHFPTDATAIGELTRAVRSCSRIQIPYRESDGPTTGMRAMRGALGMVAALAHCFAIGP